MQWSTHIILKFRNPRQDNHEIEDNLDYTEDPMAKLKMNSNNNRYACFSSLSANKEPSLLEFHKNKSNNFMSMSNKHSIRLWGSRPALKIKFKTLRARDIAYW